VYCDERLDCRAQGLTVETLKLQPGYWRTANRSLVVLPCLNYFCVGGTARSGYCLQGHTGALCEVCASGYARSALGGCTSCQGGSTVASPLTAGAFVLVLLALAIALYLRRARDLKEDLTRKLEAARTLQEAGDYASALASAMTRLKILAVHLQLSVVLPNVMSVRLPPPLTRWLGVVNIVNLDVVDLLRLGCFVNRTFYSDLLFFASAPMVLAMAGVGVWAAYVSRLRHRRLEARALAHKVSRAKDGLLPYLLGLSFFTYGWVSYIIFQTFSCQQFDDSRLLLTSDYRSVTPLENPTCDSSKPALPQQPILHHRRVQEVPRPRVSASLAVPGRSPAGVRAGLVPPPPVTDPPGRGD
jgi:hypothetical protein